MDPLDFLEPKDLLQFFRRKKTEMSLMKKPHTFLSQLRDHDLIPEDSYKKVSRMKSEDNMQKAVRDILDWVEKKQSEHIKVFWSCVFQDSILNSYPTLRLLRNSLLDGSYHFEKHIPEKVEKGETGEGKRKELSEDEGEGEKKANSAKKKTKRRRSGVCDEDEEEEEEQAGPSSRSTRGQRKKSKKIQFSSPLKKGEKNDFWNWALFKTQLPVTCGNQQGALVRDKLAGGQACIRVNSDEPKWFTPAEFEKFAGKEKFRNWKWSIRCMGIPLGKLIKEGHLESGSYQRRSKTAKKSLFPPGRSITVPDGDEDEGSSLDNQVSLSSEESSSEVADEQPEGSHDDSMKVFNVTCRDVTGVLHKKRFVRGNCGKCIRTETSWLTPMEFVQQASCPASASWRTEIKWEGNPLRVLLEREVLSFHSVNCDCKFCSPDSEDQEDQKNDDECCVCKSEDDVLVVCDYCPRAFHQKCHLPHVEDAILQDKSLWMCTFCVFKSNQQYYYSVELEAVVSSQISQWMLKCQYVFLLLCCADEKQTFAFRPGRDLTDDSAAVQTPMCFGRIADKLQRRLYETVGEFVSDVQLIFTNCASYNQDSAEILDQGNKLKELFDGEFKKVFNIRE